MTGNRYFARNTTVLTAAIANGQSLSGILRVDGLSVVAFIMPAAFTGTALTFQAAANEADTFANVHSSAGTELSVTVAASRFVTLPAAFIQGAHFIKVRSGTAGAPTAEGAARAITVILQR